jgi:hypothetical protein
MTRALITTAFVCLLLAPAAVAENGIRVRWFSQQYSQSSAGVGARIDVHERSAGHPARRSQPTAMVAVHVGSGASSRTIGGATNASPSRPPYPQLPSSSPLLKRTQPYGPGSFWYQDGAGHACQYAPDSLGPCFTITGNGNTAPAVPPLTPATIAEHVAERLTLSPGQVKTSPISAGLTGAPSWFWLDPAPATERLSASLAGEAVTVTAVPQITWRFGDGGSIDGGTGVAYQAGPVPSNAITHVYATRCLPGDQGHNPYVLPSCGSDGYQLDAAVTWQISYRANGSIAAAGALPTRTTTSSAAYPVSEARAFLVGGTAG